MIEELLKAKKITPEQFELYMLYQANELGRKSLDRMMKETFMDEPTQREWSGEGFAFYDGRRDVFRKIRNAIDFVENQLKETTNV